MRLVLSMAVGPAFTAPQRDTHRSSNATCGALHAVPGGPPVSCRWQVTGADGGPPNSRRCGLLCPAPPPHLVAEVAAVLGVAQEVVGAVHHAVVARLREGGWGAVRREEVSRHSKGGQAGPVQTRRGSSCECPHAAAARPAFSAANPPRAHTSTHPQARPLPA